MPGYPVQPMNYYPYGGYQQPKDNNQAPNNYQNNFRSGNKGNSNSNGNSVRKSKNDSKSKGEGGTNKGQENNSGNKRKERRSTFDDVKQKSDKSNSSYNKQTPEAQNSDPIAVERLIENAPKLAKDQAGCRMLQKQLELNDKEVNNRIFDRIIGDFATLMTDPFGNYLCQKLAEACTLDQMAQVIEAASSSLTNICFDPHGTRAVQKLIEIVKDQKLITMMVKYLSMDVVGLIKVLENFFIVSKRK